MQNKLQELTQQLYNEGLAKGRQEGDRYLEEARAKAEQTIAEANQKAADILAKAERDANVLRAKAESDIKMASAQALQATRKDIENLIVTKASAQTATADPEFLKQIIRSVAEKFVAGGAADVQLVLPSSLQAQLQPWVENELAYLLSAPVKADFSKKIAGGFTIAPQDGSYYISFTDRTFQDLIAEYLRPVTRKLLFGE